MTASTLVRPTPTRSGLRVTLARAVTLAPAWALPFGFGLLGTVVTLIGIGTPSLWGDEAASVLSAERSLPSLFAMLGNVDAVHGLYYLFLHFWIQLFGASDGSVRVPSAVAIGFVVAGVFVLARRLPTTRVAVIASLLAIAMPRLFSIGGEARSYAASTAIAVWLTVLLVHLIDRGVTRRLAWLGYAAGFALGIYLFLYLGMLVAVHAVYALSGRRAPGLRRRFLQSIAIAIVAAVPIIGYGYAERGQIAFLGHRDYAKPQLIAVTQWFGDPLFATVAWALILFAAVVAVRALLRRRAPFAGRVDRLAPLALLWLVLPTVLLLSLNLITPSYNLRYLSMSAPAAAIVIALGLDALRFRWVVAAATVATLALAVPSDIKDRGPYANDGGSDWSAVSQWVGTHSQTGDAVVFDDSVRPSRLPRLAMRMYPAGFQGLDDVQLVTPYYSTAGLWDVTAPLTDVTGKLATTRRVLLVELLGSHDHGSKADLTTLENLGYQLTTTHVVHRTVVYVLTRGSTS